LVAVLKLSNKKIGFPTEKISCLERYRFSAQSRKEKMSPF
jgi:hypothetical protein